MRLKRWLRVGIYLVSLMLLSMLLTLLHAAYAGRHLEVHGVPNPPFDVVIVPGCPSQESGGISPCQARRAMWAAILWQRGYARHFITSGSAVISPFVEAEALAAAMAALGVPAERIYLEPHALHTEENIYNALQLARLAGWTRLAVASDRGQAAGACQMLQDWLRVDSGHSQADAQPGAFTMDYELVKARLLQAAPKLRTIRTEPVSDFVPLSKRERERAQLYGRCPRLPSFILYPLMVLRRRLGLSPWQPFAPPTSTLQTWAERTDARR